MNKVTIYTDGSCYKSEGGYGAVITCEKLVTEIYGSFRNVTNNKMELMAAIVALELLNTPSEITIYSDSRYLVDGISYLIYQWIKSDWVTKAKNSPIKNRDLWERLLEAKKPHKVKFLWIKGHSTSKDNIRADELASIGRANVDQYTKESDPPIITKYYI